MERNSYLLAFNAHPKIGSQTMKKILAAFLTAERAWKASEGELSQKLDQRIVELIVEARGQYSVENELKKLEKHNIGYITIFDKEYPSLLKELPDAPVLLYVRGEVSVLKELGIAVVGSRKHTAYGVRAAKKLAEECASAGLAIISGLALGIDAVAHRAALDMKGITIGVLGCGLDRIYPASHLSLGREILARGGAIISEYPPGTPALKQNFPARNRIVAGLSLGTLVVEAGEESGALITALCALEYNREVFAVPGPIDSEFSRGSNQLIQKGAKLVINGSDIFEELPVELKKSQVQAKEILPESEEESTILRILGTDERVVDSIVMESGFSIVTVNTALTMMEMKGMIENIGGGRYRKIC